MNLPTTQVQLQPPFHLLSSVLFCQWFNTNPWSLTAFPMTPIMPSTMSSRMMSTDSDIFTSMMVFYGERTCLITHSTKSIVWQALILKPESRVRVTHNVRLWQAVFLELLQDIEEMLDRNLREDPYPTNAAEVRENIIPCMLFLELFLNQRHAKLTFWKWDLIYTMASTRRQLLRRSFKFQHEDLIAWMFAYEWDLKAYWLNEIEPAGGDSGRPAYHEALWVRGLPSISK